MNKLFSFSCRFSSTDLTEFSFKTIDGEIIKEDKDFLFVKDGLDNIVGIDKLFYGVSLYDSPKKVIELGSNLKIKNEKMGITDTEDEIQTFIAFRYSNESNIEIGYAKSLCKTSAILNYQTNLLDKIQQLQHCLHQCQSEVG